ncbi:MAG TPA: ABC transporter ATP-binding protein [Bacteroidetes bacterium]|nr:ABC transporter ATP-binding protein [Bacteroidota bacterium]
MLGGGHGRGDFREEESLGKVYDARLMRRLLRYLAPYRWVAFSAVLLLLLLSLLQLAGPYLAKVAIDRYIGRGNFAGLTRISVIFAGILLAQFFFRVLQTYLVQWMGQNVMRDLRLEIFSHLQRLPLSFFDRNPVGRLMTRITTDVENLNELLSSGVVAIFGDVFTLAGIVIVMLWMNWRLALVTFTVLPFLTVATFLFRRFVRRAYREIRLRIARINAYLQENITGMVIVQLFNREKRNFEHFRRLNYDYLEAYLRTIFYHAVFFPVVELLSAVALGLILWYGGLRVFSGALTVGALVAFLQYTQRFFRPISDLSEKYNIMQSAMAASERIFKLLEEPEQPSFTPPVQHLDRCRGEIEFRHVWFAYNGEDWVLKDISFRVEPGERVAFVGATGSGKTSIMSLLTRLYEPQRGQILLDGVDIRHVPLEELRRVVGVVPQDVFLFSGSVAENIRLGNRDISEDVVRQVAQALNVDRFVERLPRGFDEEVRERGGILSTGQRQLLAFARALAYDPRVIILDEATSSVDTETERLVQEALEKLMVGRTCLIVAHRLSTVQTADRIIVIHKGKIREQGTHQELLALKGIYYRLYKLQYAGLQANHKQRSVQTVGSR